MIIWVLVWKWWKFLYEIVTSVFCGITNRENLRPIPCGAQNMMPLENEQKMVDSNIVHRHNFGIKNPDGRILDLELECDPKFRAEAAGTNASTSTSDLMWIPFDALEHDHFEPPISSTVESSSSEVEFCPECAAAVSGSAADNGCVDELTSAEHSSSRERVVITDVLKKLIENIQPTVTPEVNENPTEKPSPKNPAVINLGLCSYKVVEDVAKESGMKVTSHDKSWDVIWYSRPITELRCAKFLRHQRANYFPESQRVVWKNNLALILTKMSTVFPNEYNFFPKSWSLPRDWHFMEKHARRHPKDWFIVKPNNWGCGYGIYLTNEVTKLSNCGKMTGQVYINRPLLIDDLKFDLRIYVLVTSCKPLRIFVYNEGLARFATEKYQEPNLQNKDNKYIHLTNYAVNKFSPSYVVDEIRGTLRRWTTVSKLLDVHKIDVKSISAEMDDVIVKTIIAMIPTLKYHYFRSFPDHVESTSCFQIFGFDIMIADDLHVYVLEVNGSPQFHADVKLDIEMTKNLMKDTFEILSLAEKPPDERPPTRKKNLWLAKQYESQAITQRRVEWENAHLGNYRRIYPNEHNKYYNKFLKAADHFIHPF